MIHRIATTFTPVSASPWFFRRLLPFINYRTLLGYSDYSKHTVTAGLRFSF